MHLTKPFVAGAILLSGALASCFTSRSAGPRANVADVKITIREWGAPTPKSRPHDPAVAPDGSLWFTEQFVNKLGWLDPATGAIREFPLKTETSGPHGLVADRVYIACSGVNKVGIVEPAR